ncbi:hypothetical protein [Glycomyces niveus]|uniref:NACHT domain-containing protein n=1 Tax=Glycomyces niveus TaxID=2820287 RepID=A0ABS3TXV1_9ACTN|nr:hypothetical protein [Glycomyces sp. NEAU-S30]MBO3731337.1 hypothetical protein [Glycomyces sp. NEAU-S30]
MRPEVWVPAVATLAAALAPMAISAIARYVKNDKDTEANVSVSSTGRAGRVVGLAAIPAVIAVFLAPPPWNWAAAGAYVLALTLALTWSWHRSRRHPRVLPDAAKLLDGPRAAPGFEYDRDFLPDLVRVYTKNDLARDRDALEHPNSDKPQEAAAEQRLSFDKIIADPKVRHVAITGEAGVGKTFLLRYWEHDLRHRAPSSGPVSKFKPLLVAARKLVGRASIAEAFGDVSTDVLTRPPAKGHTWLVMIDAFDEITAADDRAQVEHLVFEAVEDATKHNRPCKFVLTTRGLTDDRRRSFESRGVTEFELQPFTSEQLHAFLVNAETSIPDREHRSAAYTAAVAKADRFLKRWEDEDDLLELIKLPLLARVAATIYFHDRHLELPSRRIDIYHDAIEHWITQFHKRMSVEREQHGRALRLLHEWHGGAGEPSPDATDIAIRDLLRRLASQYLESGQSPVVALACELMRLPVHPKDPRDLDALVTLLEATGLVHDVRTAQSHFVHKSYAEYLAAPDSLPSYRTPKDWDDAFRDPERRISAIFAFAQIPHDQRSELITTMRDQGDCIHALGWIAAEGLCVVEGTGRIDREMRNALIETVLGAWPRYQSSDWWRLINGLCNVKHARDLLFRFVEEGRESESDRVDISRSLANHDPRGVDLLRDFTSEGNEPWIRWNAANELLEHDRAAARDILDELASDLNSHSFTRVNALRSLAGYWPDSAVPILREIANDPSNDPNERVNAAGALADHDALAAADLLRRFLDQRGLPDSARVYAATWLCETDRDAGVAALRAFASDRAMDSYTRGQAANTLPRFDRESGVAMLWELARDRSIAIRTRITLLIWLREYDPDAAQRELSEVAADRSLDAIDQMVITRIPARDGGRIDVATLESIASDPSASDNEQVYAIDEMLNIDQKRMMDRLRQYATDPGVEGYARSNAATYIQQYDFRLGTSLLESIADDAAVRGSEREYAYSCMLRKGHPTARQRLLEFATDDTVDPTARLEALRSLMPRLGEQGLAIVRALQSENRLQPEHRADAVAFLVDFDEDEPVNRLTDLANDPEAHEDARIKAAVALARYDLANATAALRRLAVSAEVSEGARSAAAGELVAFEPDPALRLLTGIASTPDMDDEARVKAAKSVAEVDRESGRVLLFPLAQDTGLYRNLTVDAAYWLYKFGDDRGKTLTISYATGPDLDDQARVAAARNLLELDPEFGTGLLTAFAADFGLDDKAQTDAALALARVDRDAGLRALRDIAEAPPTIGGRKARAAWGITKYQPDEGKRLLHELVADTSERGLTSVLAADALVDFDRDNGLSILCDLAEDGSIDPCAREVAVRRIGDVDHVTAAEMLWKLVMDESAPALVRVEAADDLPLENFSQYLALQRRFVDDPDFSGFGRVGAALKISFGRKVEGVERLRALSADPELDETERIWAEITLSWRDAGVRASLERRQVDPSAVDFARLRKAADDSIVLDLRTGHPFRRRVTALEARAGARIVHD